MEMVPQAIFRAIRSRPPLTADEAMRSSAMHATARPEPALSRPIHARRSHKKTRTGCHVCKIRRVKCDETKPACTRCTSTGRSCEYYPVLVPPANKSQSPPHWQSYPAHDGLSLYCVTWEIPGDDAERRSLCYMRERAIYDISGYFESEFWDRLVLQISYTEPAVRHALLGLSSLCETYESQGFKDDQDKRVQFALQHYNKAVGLLANSLSARQPRLEVVLASCLIFVWFEFMRNDLDAGLRHFKGGLMILDSFRQPNKPDTSSSQMIDESLLRSFSRLKIHAAIYGSPSFEFVTEGDESIRRGVPASFSSIEGARESLHTLLDTVTRFLRGIGDPNFLATTQTPPLGLSPHALEATCESLLCQLRSWHRAIKNSPASIFESQNPRHTAAMCHLHMCHKTVTILLETLFTQSQMIYDRYDSCFDRILTLAEQLIQNSQHMGRIIFFDMGVMAPLFYVVLKCRNLDLRRKGLSLLRLAPCREGMWYREDTIAYAEWKIGIEERGRGQLSEAEALPESARVSNEHLKEVIIGGRQKTVVSFQCQGPDGVEYGQDVTDLNTRMGQL
ncbi:hypothetical protein B0T11DRAFT_246245, partial [Plectosphaerella cucumerina]